jgi:hypothetical protein
LEIRVSQKSLTFLRASQLLLCKEGFKKPFGSICSVEFRVTGVCPPGSANINPQVPSSWGKGKRLAPLTFSSLFLLLLLILPLLSSPSFSLSPPSLASLPSLPPLAPSLPDLTCRSHWPSRIKRSLKIDKVTWGTGTRTKEFFIPSDSTVV